MIPRFRTTETDFLEELLGIYIIHGDVMPTRYEGPVLRTVSGIGRRAGNGNGQFTPCAIGYRAEQLSLISIGSSPQIEVHDCTIAIFSDTIRIITIIRDSRLIPSL